MDRKYLGEVSVSQADTSFAGFGPTEWALHFIATYGGDDGSHHKAWVLDQVARILHGTPVVLRRASWSDGLTEIRIETGEPTAAYHQWVADLRDGDDGPETYDYDTGIAP